MKWILSLITIYLVIATNYAQSIDLFLLSNAGGASQKGDIEYSVGEVLIFGNDELAQGFHQEGTLISHIIDNQADIDVVVFPNPFNSKLLLSSESQKLIGVRLLDNQGKLWYNSQVIKFPQEIDLSGLAPGNYYLELLNDQNIPAVYKVIKIQ